ncbi:hypothetical protein PFTANZ_05870, partial [Plasmodium falciparum Tanzania (2000708)]
MARQPSGGPLGGAGVGAPGAAGGGPQQAQQQFGLTDEASTPDPQTQLKDGIIPEEFKRQMFYTLGDYRDICVGNTPNGIDTVSASGDNKSGDKNIKDISEKIGIILKQSASKAGGPPNSGKTPQEWWEENGPHIWNGMICALTYKENGSDKPQVDDKVKKAFFGENGTSNEPIPKYKYETVTLQDENSGDGPKPAGVNEAPPKLTDFIKRPPYFRYLEEWGQNFCKERKKRLEEIKKDCKVDENDR